MEAHGIFHALDLIQSPSLFRDATPPVKLGVFGDPVAHSLSPVFHNAALASCGLGVRYAKIHVPEELAAAAFRALPSAGFLGVNVTIPHKAAALAAVDEADSYAHLSGAVNTVVVAGDKLLGFNTDGPGLERAIKEEFSADLRDLNIVLLGAGGGAGRAIAMHCATVPCKRLVLANRTFEKARGLAQEIASVFRSASASGNADSVLALPLGSPALQEQLLSADLVINATSVGMQRSDAPILPAGWLKPHLMVYDTVYAGGRSRLLDDAAAVGARTANGLSMLLHQGALSFEIWFKRAAPLDVMRAALLALT